MGKKLTEAQFERQHRDGFVYPIDAFAAEEARRYRRAMEEFEAAQGRELTKGRKAAPASGSSLTSIGEDPVRLPLCTEELPFRRT